MVKMSIQISVSDEAAEALWWLIKNQLEGSITPFWDDDEAEEMNKLLARIGKATNKRSRLLQMREKANPQK